MKQRSIDYRKKPLTHTYGENRFGDRTMRERLPRSVYEDLKRVQAGECELTSETAEVVANAMKDWAIERGATHYTHWFQPMTGRTAEKHDAFIQPNLDGGILMEFSGKALIKGESDASSFPSGGLRATFEARGYTAWDTTSPGFLKDDMAGLTLYIPTAFVSYNGEALDKKVPLLRSIDALGKAAARVLKAIGHEGSTHVIPTVGAEQEYFLVEKNLYDKRPDLALTGRTLLGTPASKGQELEDHYYGQIPERVSGFMRELNYDLWRLGVSAKTQHKEVAPNQFEIATVYSAANLAADDNQLVMETLGKVAERHGLVALLHEKPFAGVNGSGKHINWSLATADGINLLDPGASPNTNARFLLFLAGVVRAVDRYASLLRATVAGAGNDLRLGANEAPPAIVSVFLGEQLASVLERISGGDAPEGESAEHIVMGHTALPKLPRDLTDRNRTSPFAFTGDKFEFRMAPSSESISAAVSALNAAVAESLNDLADSLERSEDRNAAMVAAVKDIWERHKRVVFNGNGYSSEWLAEARARGLPDAPDSPAAFEAWRDKKNLDMLAHTSVLSADEAEAIYHIELERYAKHVHIEAATMLDMVVRGALPGGIAYLSRLAKAVDAAKGIGAPCTAALEIARDVAQAVNATDEAARALRNAIGQFGATDDPRAEVMACRRLLVPAMATLRLVADELERITPCELWPFPAYQRLLFEI
ncbi:MAG: glutamine synthetase type III [Spirochaetales bacterium]|nr:MAG: glutamine synthetase type III [Spirochaetales bacterium]